MAKRNIIQARKKHEFPREYNIWRAMRARCHNPTATGYEWYGARGLTVAPEWRNSFDAFIDHIGPAPDKSYTIDRINNASGYWPGNVRWATRRQQAANRGPRKKTRPSTRLHLFELHEWLNE